MNMLLAYGAAFTSGRAAQRLFRDRSLNRWITHHTTFSNIHHRLCHSGTVHQRVDGQGHVRTCLGTVLQYVENKVLLALKRSVAAHSFLNKISFNDGYLSGPKVCRSNLETLCIVGNLIFRQTGDLRSFIAAPRRSRGHTGQEGSDTAVLRSQEQGHGQLRAFARRRSMSWWGQHEPLFSAVPRLPRRILRRGQGEYPCWINYNYLYNFTAVLNKVFI